MKPIRLGDRGPAVEDIQRRLRTLGYDLGRAGIDGIFMGATADAVRSFQRELGLRDDGFVGDQTWSALVDATFTLGDRMLYLRVPHFHGRDVQVLQDALNILGFACGDRDGIFGAFTERAVREFQRNAGLHADGIVGGETVRAVDALRHVWEGKDPRSHSGAQRGLARAADVLSRVVFSVGGLDEVGGRVAGRMVNLAIATNQESRASLVDSKSKIPPGTSLVLLIGGRTSTSEEFGRPVVSVEANTLVARLMTAVSACQGTSSEIVVELPDAAGEDERAEQRSAVVLLDAVCALFE
jgi:peptidoglycan hydrolase-like protein with peptidoglycan-binding domain